MMVAQPRRDRLCGNCDSFDPDRGWCRHNPPMVIMTAPIAGATQGDPKSFYPRVSAADWCAQWHRETVP